MSNNRTASIRVLIVDDSAVARRLIRSVLATDPRLDVVGEAVDGVEAVRLTADLTPDVVTMDIDMPRMDGIEATATIMANTPTPIVVLTGRDIKDVTLSMAAIDAGALTLLAKPPGPSDPGFEAEAASIARVVRVMAGVRVIGRRRAPSAGAAPREAAAVQTNTTIAPSRPPGQSQSPAGAFDVVAIAASTGGPAALAAVLSSLPAPLPAPIVVVQHLPEGFEAGLARWLADLTPMPVRIAGDGDPLTSGTVTIAPSGRHMVVRSTRIRLLDEPPRDGHRPSADPMFSSAASSFGQRACGIILTGMGSDGADGLGELRAAGGHVIAQDEESSVIYGMPGAAVARGAASEILPLDKIGRALWARCTPGRVAT